MKGAWTWRSVGNKLAAAIAAATLITAEPAGAQPKKPDKPAPAEKAPAWKGVAARALARTAQLDLRIVNTPEDRDFRIAAAMLETACRLSPTDQDLLRLEVDAASGSHDDARVAELTSRLLALDPADAVSQLRLISARIAALQDADARLALYDKFLGPRGASFDDSIRSRLALDAAVLLRERGDINGFINRLADSTDLDSTNKDAAAMAVAFYNERCDDPIGRLTLLINLLMADPVDPDTHLLIARELGAGGAYAGAKRFYETTQTIFAAANQQTPRDVITEWYTCVWNIEGPDRIVTDLRSQVEEQRALLLRQKDAAAKAKTPGAQPKEVPDPQTVRLTVELERVRAAAASAMGDEGQLQYAIDEMTRSFRTKEAELDDPAARAALSEEDIAEKRRWLTGELCWMRLWCGRQIDEAAATLKVIDADPALPPEGRPTLDRMKGWLLIRQGDLDGAQSALTPLAGDDPFAAIGLALVTELRGDAKGAAEQYGDLSRRLAGTLGGAWSRTRAFRLSGKMPDQPGATPKLQRLASGVPDWLDAGMADARKLMSMQVVLDSQRADVLDRVSVTIRIRNVSPIPLGLGPDGPINTRILLSPKVEVGMFPAATGGAGSVVRVDRRLRLMPQESVEVSCWADGGVLGWFLERTSLASSHIRWQAMQGFLIDPSGLYRPGPLCLSSGTEILIRNATSHGRESTPGLVRWIQTGSLDDLADCMMTIKSRASRTGDEPGGLSDAEKADLAKALAAKYPTLEPDARILVLAEMPPATHEPWLAPLDAAAREEKDDNVLVAVLSTRVADVSDAALDRAAASADHSLAALAAEVRARLDAGGVGYSSVKKKPDEAPPPPPPPVKPSGASK